MTSLSLSLFGLLVCTAALCNANPVGNANPMGNKQVDDDNVLQDELVNPVQDADDVPLSPDHGEPMPDDWEDRHGNVDKTFDDPEESDEEDVDVTATEGRHEVEKRYALDDYEAEPDMENFEYDWEFLDWHKIEMSGSKLQSVPTAGTKSYTK